MQIVHCLIKLGSRKIQPATGKGNETEKKTEKKEETKTEKV